jgi:NAD(P)-dependent dehydrogenase (short-subunit alcohol dehydrogenase family)
MKEFRDKVAAITGAGSGIGRALALDLAQRGCHVALCDINAECLAETAAQVVGHGVRVTQATVDVADRAAMHAWADAVARDFGHVNLVFNNAGVALVSTIEGVAYENLEWIMGINFWGVVHGTKAFLPHLIASGDGHVVNLSSVFGLAGVPTQSGYNAAKFAVRGFTECLRAELEMMRCGVSATCVHPGGIKTNIARAARACGSVRALGLEDGKDEGEFETTAFTTPEKAARIILRAVQKNRRRVMVGPDAYVFDWITRLFPARYHRIVIALMRSAHQQRRKAGKTADATETN